MADIYTIAVSKSPGLTLAPETEVQSILQNLYVLLSTLKYTVPLDRHFGMTVNFLDTPTPAAKAAISAEMAELIEEYEPRVELLAIDFVQSAEDETQGRLLPQVTVKVHT